MVQFVGSVRLVPVRSCHLLASQLAWERKLELLNSLVPMVFFSSWFVSSLSFSYSFPSPLDSSWGKEGKRKDRKTSNHE